MVRRQEGRWFRAQNARTHSHQTDLCHDTQRHYKTQLNTTKHNESTTTQWHTTLTHTAAKHQTDLFHDTQRSQWYDDTTTQLHTMTQRHTTLTHAHTPCNTNWPVSRHRTTYNKIQLHIDTQRNTRTRQNTTTQQHNTQTHYYYTLQHQTANGSM